MPSNKMKKEMSPLQKLRLNYEPTLPSILEHPLLVTLKSSPFPSKEPTILGFFPKSCQQPLLTFAKGKGKTSAQPLKVGVVFSGGQASGGHNVITGLFDALKKIHRSSQLIGFLDGPSGIIKNKTKEITRELLANYRNQGGFDLLGSGRTKIEKMEDLEASENTVRKLSLDGLVIVGGDDSNTNAALLAEYFLQRDLSTKVIGVPKTIDGDLQNEHVEISFGFDTACKVYAEMIGNIGRDCLSAKKYYHFIKLMGRSASHIALECALQTHPNLTLIGEEIFHEKKSLHAIVQEMANLIQERAALNKNYGLILIPEGIIEFIPEMQTLIAELNQLLAQGSIHYQKINALDSSQKKRDAMGALLQKETAKLFSSLPSEIQEQLLLERDPHGNVLLSQIETEKLFIKMVERELYSRNTYKGKFQPLSHFFGYEGRASLPSNFDAQYCTALGSAAAILIHQGATGYMCGLGHLKKPVEEWVPKGVPITSLIHLEMRSGKKKPVIRKALVDLYKDPFLSFKAAREKWSMSDHYLTPGPIQFFGDKKITDTLTLSLQFR